MNLKGHVSNTEPYQYSWTDHLSKYNPELVNYVKRIIIVASVFSWVLDTYLTCQCLHRLPYKGLQHNDDVIRRLLLGVQLGAVSQQLRATWREDVAQLTHKHRTSWRDSEKKCVIPRSRERGNNRIILKRLRYWEKVICLLLNSRAIFVICAIWPSTHFLILIQTPPFSPLLHLLENGFFYGITEIIYWNQRNQTDKWM